MQGDDGSNTTLQAVNDGTPALIIAHDGADWGGGHATSDVIVGGAGEDTLDGGDGNDTLLGEADNDLLRGDGGADSLAGGTGDDTLQGGDGNDTLAGGDGNDSLDGGSGADSLEGGSGIDTVSYAGSGGGVAVDLGTGGASGGDAEGDSLSGVEVVIGSDHDDTLVGGTGAETLEGGAGADVLLGAAGNDSLSGGTGDDYIEGGAGDDTVLGGDGNDLLYGDDLGDNGRDLVIGGAGDDTLIGNAESDTLLGGDGNDLLYGGYLGQPGGDVLEGGDGIDTVSYEYSNDAVAVDLGAGNGSGGDAEGDTLSGIEAVVGSDYGDTLSGSAGADTLSGGAGDDRLQGGDGRDQLEGGAGNDTLTGGAGADVFVADGTADRITDFDTTTGISGNGTDDNDFIDLTQFYNPTTLAAWNAANPALTFDTPLDWLRHDALDGVLTQAGGLVIEDAGAAVAPRALVGENTGVICYARGTRIATARGLVVVERLREGDRVKTRDGGWQPIRWIGSTTVSGLGADAPVVIAPGAFGNRRELTVSPRHRMLVTGWEVEMHLGVDEAFVPARLMIDGHRVRQVPRAQVEYFHILLDRHEVIFAEGAASESFHPGAEGWKTLSDGARGEILDRFPALEDGFAAYGPTARPVLTGTEAGLLRALRGIAVAVPVDTPAEATVGAPALSATVIRLLDRFAAMTDAAAPILPDAEWSPPSDRAA